MRKGAYSALLCHFWLQNGQKWRRRRPKCRTQGFKTSVHQPKGDVAWILIYMQLLWHAGRRNVRELSHTEIHITQQEYMLKSISYELWSFGVCLHHIVMVVVCSQFDFRHCGAEFCAHSQTAWLAQLQGGLILFIKRGLLMSRRRALKWKRETFPGETGDMTDTHFIELHISTEHRHVSACSAPTPRGWMKLA